MPKGVYPHFHMMKQKIYPADMVERVRQLYADGLSQVEVGAALRVTQKVIWLLMSRHNIARRPRRKRDQFGAQNDSWRGDAAGYKALHRRVRVARGAPQICTRCGKAAQEWANLTGRYEDVEDYAPMCCSCHRRYDKARRLKVVMPCQPS